MPRKLLLFGNGLGRSINNEIFDLRNAMQRIWLDPDFLSNEERAQIVSALDGVEVEVGPANEDQLLGAQLALIACDILEHVAGEQDIGHWLTERAIAYPSALRRYVFRVATYFHGHVDELVFDERWDLFTRYLVEFVFDSKPHVATLNYDDLLYGPFNDVQNYDGRRIQICKGFSGTLVDGWTRSLGFSYENMRRLNEGQKAYYLHLHGSPLYVDDVNGLPTKITRAQLAQNDQWASRHIVLTHGSMKPMVISNSPILRMYWDHLNIALSEVQEIILFGYSGADDHLNKVILRHRGDVPIRIVERSHVGEDRHAYWRAKFTNNFTIEEYENILDFWNW